MKKIFINNFINLQLKFVSFILISLSLSACLSFKPSSTKSGKNYFETFYVGKEGTQYFVRPILFKDEKSNEELSMDISFRYRNEIKDSAIVNISIKSPLIYKTIDSLKLSNNIIEIKNKKIDLLFNEKNKKEFSSRHSTKFSLKEIKEMFNNDAWEVIIYNQNKISTFKPNKKTIKAIGIVRDRIFVLM